MSIKSVIIERAFHLNPYPKSKVAQDMREGDDLYTDTDFPSYTTKSADVTYKVLKKERSTKWYFYFKGRCGCKVVFEKLLDKEQEYINKAFRRKPKVLVPHCSATRLKGLGYPTFLYTRALEKGILLATDVHSEDAAILWKSVAAKTGATIVYVNGLTREISLSNFEEWGRNRNIFKVMVPKQLNDLLKRVK